MSRLTWCAVFCAGLLLPNAAFSGPIVINEVVYDDGSTDDREYVELYNSSAAPVDISGWVVRNSDTVAPPGDNNADYTIPGAPNSATTVLAAGDYYVISSFAGVLNVDLVATGTLENDNEAVELLDGSGAVQDSLSFETNKGPVAVPMEGPGYFGNSNPPDVAGTPLNVTVSLGRFVDGRDTNNNGRDFGMRPSTPGTANNSGFITHYSPPDPTGQTVGTIVAGLTGSFVNARYIDPTVADANNPNAIAPAPTTGNRAIVAWDASGGGNGVTSNQVFNTTQGGFKIYAYLDTSDMPQQFNASNVNFTGSEVTVYGIGGGDPFTNLTDLGGNIGLGAATLPAAETANGFTGVAWVYERTAISGAIAATQMLYLVDANDGGDADLGGNTPLDWTILQAIDISGLNSDWFELGISVDPLGNGVATFNGNTYAFITSTSLHSGAFNVGYRENLQMGSDGTPDAIMRPATFTIPEPGVLTLCLLGLSAYVGVRRRN